MSPFDIAHTAYDLLFDFNRNFASILYRFRDIASYLSILFISADKNGCILGISTHQYPYLLEALYWS